MRFKRVNEEEPGFSSIAPLIDIVFLLLIFFMATTPPSPLTGLSVSLPETRMDYPKGETHTITITVDRQGALMVKGAKVQPADLTTELSRLRSSEGVFHVLLEADKNVTHGRVVEVMDIAKQAGAESIIIAAYLSRHKEP
jgi:biopolymer transport protein ExbD